MEKQLDANTAEVIFRNFKNMFFDLYNLWTKDPVQAILFFGFMFFGITIIISAYKGNLKISFGDFIASIKHKMSNNKKNEKVKCTSENIEEKYKEILVKLEKLEKELENEEIREMLKFLEREVNKLVTKIEHNQMYSSSLNERCIRNEEKIKQINNKLEKIHEMLIKLEKDREILKGNLDKIHKKIIELMKLYEDDYEDYIEL